MLCQDKLLILSTDLNFAVAPKYISNKAICEI